MVINKKPLQFKRKIHTCLISELGLTGVPVFNTNNNCSSASSALMLARLLVLSGQYRCVLALGKSLHFLSWKILRFLQKVVHCALCIVLFIDFVVWSNMFVMNVLTRWSYAWYRSNRTKLWKVFLNAYTPWPCHIGQQIDKQPN